MGFGRNESETLINSVRNLTEVLIDDEKTFAILKNAIASSTPLKYAADIPTEACYKSVLTQSTSSKQN